MCWPARAELYADLRADAEAAHAEVASTLAAYEPVTMITAPGTAERVAQRCGSEIDVVELALDDSWFRDTGPIYVFDTDGRRVALDWTFNAWGNKVHPYIDDAALAARWAEHRGDPLRSIDMVLEGGSIAVDGRGVLLTTSECLLNPNRNPSMLRTEIEATLADELGVNDVQWLPFGLAGDDDTDGHVDNVAAFAEDPSFVVVQGCDDPAESDHVRLQINRRTLEGAATARGPLEVIEVPVLPFAQVGGRRVAVPYLNYYVANGVVVVPLSGHDADADMLDVIADAYPQRDIAGLPVGDVLAYGGGGIHCITMQIPARRNEKW